MLDRFFAPAIWLMGRLSYLFRTLLLFIMILALLVGGLYLNEYATGETALELVAYDLLMILFALWLYLFVGSYLGVKKAIEYLGQMSDAATQGELLEHEPLQSRDEFGKISHAMNRIIGTMQQNLTMLREYQGAVDSGTLVNKTDPDGKITYVNAAFEKLSGYTLDELRGKTHRIFRAPSTSDLQIQVLWDTLGDKEIYRGIFENLAKDGSSFYIKITIIPILDKLGNVTEYLAIMSDITALKAHEKRLETQLYTDDLTGFDNRNAFHKAVAKARDPKMMLLNIDGFSALNTIYGEAVGDVLITQLGLKLQAMMKDSDLQLFRMAADEFAILADESVNENNFQEDVVMLSHYLNPLQLHCAGHEIRLYVSIGAVIASRNDGKRPLMAMAAIALKEAKKRSQRTYYFYSEIADASFKLEENLAAVERLDYAIKNETISCHYQPIYDVKRESVYKYESLMRLIDSEGKVHMPSEFIGVAKGAHLYAHLTYQVVLNTLAMAALHPELFFTINIDIEDIEDTATSAFIIDQLRQSTCAERITFELVESKALEENEMVESFLSRIKTLGCKIAIDDFGSGYSNYAYLLRLGVDLVKIDGSLIADAHKDENKRRIVKSIIDICHDLGMQTVTEYVHNEEIFDIVVGLGTDYVQGAYIAIAGEKLGEV
jgi:PAS domain S-box-containing protein/diguanylate cyclase (GGDEF)-like protein